jgi:putative ABC transport system permease protein
MCSLRAHRFRAVLVLLHIVISVALVVVVAGMAGGLGSIMNKSIDSFVCSLAISQRTPAQSGANAPRGLQDSDVEALVNRADPQLVSAVFPVASGQGVLRTGPINYLSEDVVGSQPGYLQMKLMQVAAGSMFTERQYQEKARVVLIGPKLVSYLFNGNAQRALDSNIVIGRLTFQIIGILSGDDQDDDTVLMPFSTARALLYGGKPFVQSIGAIVTRTDNIPAAVHNVETILDREHFVKDANKRDYAVTSYNYLLPFLNQWLDIPFWFAAGATLALLFIGILGLANVMVFAVTERDSEIRERRRSGTRAGTIIGEFLMASVIIAGLGGVIGVVLGVGVTLAARLLLPSVSTLYSMGLPDIPVEAIVLSLAASLLMGLLAGAYPALRLKARWRSLD